MKKILTLLLSITIIFYTSALAEDTPPSQDINKAQFPAGTVNPSTTTAYETTHFVTTVTDRNGNVIATGTWGKSYDNNGAYTGGERVWGYSGGITPENVIADMKDANGNPLSAEEQQRILTDLATSGGKINFDPRFSICEADANGDIVKNVTGGGTKNFSVVASNLTSEEIKAMISWSNITRESFDKQYYYLTIDPSSNPPPTMDPDPDTDPEPEHTHNWNSDSRPCDEHGGDGGSPATTDDVSFNSAIDSTEAYRKTHPYSLGSKFTLSGNGHIDGEVVTPSYPVYWSCSGYSIEWCECGAGYQWYCDASGSYTKWEPENATYTDTYHNVIMGFKGFTVDGKNNVVFDPSVKTNTGSKPDRNSIFSEDYEITSLKDTELKADSTSGLLYGTATVSCTCGCSSNTYNIYFDLTPPPPPTSEKFNLTVKVEPEEGGTVRIGSSGAYLVSETKEFEIDSSFIVEAKANEGYKFIGWYDVSNNKYSEELKYINTMPGYDLTLIAKFIPQDNYYNITVYSDGNGYVSFGENEEIGHEISSNVLKGSDKTINSLPDEDFIIDYWERLEVIYNDEEDGYETRLSILGSGETLEISNIQEDYIIVAHFKPIHPYFEYKELVTKPYGPGYTIGGTKYAIIGQYYPIWAFPFPNSNFYYWIDNISDNSTEKFDYFGQFDYVEMPKDYDPYLLTAYFEEIADLYQLNVMSDGNGKVAIDKKRFSLSESLTTDDKTPHVIDADPNDGFEFSHWTDMYGETVSFDDEWEDVIVDQDMLYIANFIGAGEFYISVESAGGGTVSGNIDNAVYGEMYPIGAYPDENYEFLYWEDKETGEITEYCEEDWIVMPERNLELIAHFRELQVDQLYSLTVESTEGGSAIGSGIYPPETYVWIEASPAPGYVFAGWYVDNQLVSIEPGKYITMPYYDLTVRAVFRKADGYVESPFKILSIRDIRWQDYFAGGGNVSSNYLYIPRDAGKNDVLVNIADLIDNEFNKYRNINYGYAVEFELVTSGIYKADSTLVITPTIYERSSSGSLTELDIDLGDYSKITSSSNKSREMFMITSSEKVVRISDSPVIDNPIVNWNWVYYLPLDIYEDIYDESDGNNIVIKFDIKVKTKGGAEFDYVKVINYMYNESSSYENRSAWGGNVFTYNMKSTLLDDIYDNATN